MAEPPAPPRGISYRRYGGEVDLEGMARLINLTMQHIGVVYHQTTEEMANHYRHLTNCDLDTDLLIGERDGEIVGYRRVFWYVEDATDHRIMASVGRVHPEIAESPVTAQMLAWADDRMAEIAHARPHEGETFAQTWVEGGDAATIRAVESAGYEVAQVYAEMTRSLLDPIPDHPLPAGVEIRPVSDADRRRVWEADQEAFRDHVGFSMGTEEDYREFASRPTMDPSLWKVAFAGGDIAGQVLNYVDAGENAALGIKRGWTEWISTQREWRGRGLAKALITDSMRMLREMGLEEAALGVHTANPTGAFALYNGLGYVMASQTYEYRKALS